MDKVTIMYPYALYKYPGPNDIHGTKLDYLTVANEAELDAALADGWQTSTFAALKVMDIPIPKTICDPDAAKEPIAEAPVIPPKSVGKPVNWKK